METDSERHHSTKPRMYNGRDFELYVKLCTYSFEVTCQKSKECNTVTSRAVMMMMMMMISVCVCVRERDRECVCVCVCV